MKKFITSSRKFILSLFSKDFWNYVLDQHFFRALLTLFFSGLAVFYGLTLGYWYYWIIAAVFTLINLAQFYDTYDDNSSNSSSGDS